MLQFIKIILLSILNTIRFIVKVLYSIWMVGGIGLAGFALVNQSGIYAKAQDWYHIDQIEPLGVVFILMVLGLIFLGPLIMGCAAMLDYVWSFQQTDSDN